MRDSTHVFLNSLECTEEESDHGAGQHCNLVNEEDSDGNLGLLVLFRPHKRTEALVQRRCLVTGHSYIPLPHRGQLWTAFRHVAKHGARVHCSGAMLQASSGSSSGSPAYNPQLTLGNALWPSMRVAVVLFDKALNHAEHCALACACLTVHQCHASFGQACHTCLLCRRCSNEGGTLDIQCSWQHLALLQSTFSSCAQHLGTACKALQLL